MKSKISFSGSIAFISAIAQFAATLPDDVEFDVEPASLDVPGIGAVDVKLGQGPSAAPDYQFEIGPDGLIIVPPQKQREKADYKAHRIAAEKARDEQMKQMTTTPVMPEPVAAQPQVPTEPNAFANYAIQQQHIAAQPVQPQTMSFPSAPAPTAQQPAFPASQPAQAPVATNGQPWLNPATINQQGPTFNDLNNVIQPLVTYERPRQILGEWLAHKQIQNFEAIADQPALLAEAYTVATQIRDGILK